MKAQILVIALLACLVGISFQFQTEASSGMEFFTSESNENEDFGSAEEDRGLEAEEEMLDDGQFEDSVEDEDEQEEEVEMEEDAAEEAEEEAAGTEDEALTQPEIQDQPVENIEQPQEVVEQEEQKQENEESPVVEQEEQKQENEESPVVEQEEQKQENEESPVIEQEEQKQENEESPKVQTPEITTEKEEEKEENEEEEVEGVKIPFEEFLEEEEIGIKVEAKAPEVAEHEEQAPIKTELKIKELEESPAHIDALPIAQPALVTPEEVESSLDDSESEDRSLINAPEADKIDPFAQKANDNTEDVESEEGWNNESSSNETNSLVNDAEKVQENVDVKGEIEDIIDDMLIDELQN